MKPLLLIISIVLFTVLFTIVQLFKSKNYYQFKNECSGGDLQLTPVKHKFVVSYLGKRTSDRGSVYANISWYSDYKDGSKLQTPIEQNYPYTFFYTFPCQPLTFGNLLLCYKVDVSMSEFPTKKTIYVPNYVKNLNIIISENNDDITFKYLDNIDDGICKYKWVDGEWIIDQ